MKLLDTKIGTDWTTLNELITVQPGDKVALYNADANKAIYYTENEEGGVTAHILLPLMEESE